MQNNHKGTEHVVLHLSACVSWGQLSHNVSTAVGYLELEIAAIYLDYIISYQNMKGRLYRLGKKAVCITNSLKFHV